MYRCRLWQLLLTATLALLLASNPTVAAEYQPLPPTPAPGLSGEWLLHDVARNRLILYLPDYHAPAHAYYQWVRVRREEPFPITFTAQAGLSLFLDNKLLFTADRSTSYSLDLARLLPPGLSAGQHLLAVWQPTGSPVLSSFTAGTPATPLPVRQATIGAQPRLPGQQGQNVFLGSLLALGLLYGGVRKAYPAGLTRMLQVEALLSKGGADSSFLAKPAFTLFNLMLVLLFAFSLSLLLVAIHTNLQNLPLLRRFLDVPEAAIVARIGLYALVISAFVLGKYLFLELLGYIFDVQGLVNLHYREFLRATLLTGLLLPGVLLLYLGLSNGYPQLLGWLANGFVLLLLTSTVLRVGVSLHRQASLLTLQLFAYLCATEILPLAVVLKLIVFSY